MSESALSTQPSSALAPMSVKDLLQQVSLIQEVMKNVMKDGEHYGKVPGCGDKPALFKPGAEKLCFVFRLAPSYIIEERTLEKGHREYRVKCRLHTIAGQVFVSEGEGAATTHEAKYRFRTGSKKLTGRPVPKEFWDLRASQPVKAQELIGGAGFSTAKNGISGQWEICEVGERIEHDNPADYYNTILKMAQKRAHVAATLSATAASDCFSQDVEDIAENLKAYDAEVETVPLGGAGTAQHSQPSNSQTSGNPPGHAQKENQNPSPKPGGWRDFVVPFGTNKGKKIGELPGNSLSWYIKEYEPKGYGNKGPSASDLAFRKALDEAKAEMSQHAGETAAKIEKNLSGPPAGVGDKLDEDVPF